MHKYARVLAVDCRPRLLKRVVVPRKAAVVKQALVVATQRLMMM